MIAGVQSRRVLNAQEKRVVAYHEAGHALCGELLPAVDRVHRISIVPRGRALGYTLNLPEEDRYLKTREELLDWMTVLLGRARPSRSCSARSRPAPPTTSRRSRTSPARWCTTTRWATPPSGAPPKATYASPRRRCAIRDEERQELIEEGRRAALKMILAHRRQLDALARELLEHEVLDRDAIDRVMAGTPRLERAPGIGLRVVAATPLEGPAGGGQTRV